MKLQHRKNASLVFILFYHLQYIPPLRRSVSHRTPVTLKPVTRHTLSRGRSISFESVAFSALNLLHTTLTPIAHGPKCLGSPLRILMSPSIRGIYKNFYIGFPHTITPGLLRVFGPETTHGPIHVARSLFWCSSENRTPAFAVTLYHPIIASGPQLLVHLSRLFVPVHSYLSEMPPAIEPIQY